MATMGTGIGFLRIISATRFFLFMCLPFLCIIASEIYHPDDLYSINCGSSEDFTTFDGRNWTADNNNNNNKLLFSENQNDVSSSTSVSAEALTSTTIEGPYTTARVSYSQFAYSFPVTTPGPKFIRLFFYPTSYQNFNPTKAYFSVKSGEYTLLKDFNATLYADADDDPSDTFFREYSVCVKDGHKTLNITFIPSTAKNHTDPYYAFINGIEVVSMPTYLYYTKPDDYTTGLQLVGYGDAIPYRLENYSALETKYRLNVGGRIIPPSSDTGMLRYWYGDDNYVASQTGLSYQKMETNLSFTMIPEYTAPTELYQKQRDMTDNATMNLRFNITWVLPVDSGFTYMLRLHFCEFSHSEVQQAGERRFFIYIQDQMVEENADVLLWTGGRRGVPIVKDYAVMVVSENQKNTNISLKMSPKWQSLYADAFLEGLELFKINDSQGNLAGPNPDPQPQKSSTPQVPLQIKSSNKAPAIVAGAVSSVALYLFVVVIIAFFLNKLQKKNKNGSKHKPDVTSSLPTNLCRRFSLEEIRAATNNFNELSVVGVGGFGNVYKGYINNDATPVAIKRLKPGSHQGVREFLNEIEMLSQLRHRHLVSLIGYCYEINEMILVYDFMTRGTLCDHLYNTDNPSLSWKQRLQICIGAAHGLDYLHTGAKHMIIHRDVKSTNILLDEKWIAKVSDFGLSRVGPTGTSMTHVSTVVKGSLGYLDPEYYKRQRLTEKSDVYSFGVVLLEVLCGRPPLLRCVEKRQVSLVNWARESYNDANTLREIVDPTLNGQIAPECLGKFGDLALSCLVDNATERPSMSDVVQVLELILQLQENFVGDGVLVEGRGDCEESDDIFSSSTDSRYVSDNSKSNGE